MTMHHIETFKLDELSGINKGVLMAICAIADSEGAFVLDIQEIRDRVCLSRLVAEGAVADLNRAGYFDVVSNGDGWTTLRLRMGGTWRSRSEAAAGAKIGRYRRTAATA